MKKIGWIGFVVLAAVLAGCEDSAVTEFQRQNVVEGYLLVDRPVGGIRLAWSQSVTDTFRIAGGIIPDADVKITGGGRTFQLQYVPGDSGVGQYWYPDTTQKVQPNTAYDLSITLKDGSLITGHTVTPGRVAWMQTPPDTLYYPKDTVNLASPDSLGFHWTAVPGLTEYLVSAVCTDTLDYGKYLTPATTEKNRRIVRFFDDADPWYNETVRWGYAPATNLPIVWAAFKWYGPHIVNVFAADRNMVNWFKMTHWAQNPSYDNLLGSINGGIGVFGSASTMSGRVFIVKNQP